MALEDFLGDLSGGFEGAGSGAQILGGMSTAKIGAASNPWVGGGILAAGAGLGVANAMDPAKRRAQILNERLGRQEADMNDVTLQSERDTLNDTKKKRAAFDQFGNIFSGYLAAMAKAKNTGQAAFQHDVGVL